MSSVRHSAQARIAPRPVAAARPADALVTQAASRLDAAHAQAPLAAAPAAQATTAKLLGHAKQWLARKAYRPTLMAGREALKHGGEFVRAYVGVEKDPSAARFAALSRLFATGEFGGAFGANLNDGVPKVLSDVLKSAGDDKVLSQQVKRIGRDMVLPDGQVIEVKPAELGLMVGISGMSFPQLSAPSILSLLYSHVSLAKQGVRSTFNTGEGGPLLHLSLLSGDREGLRQAVVSHALATGEIKALDKEHGKIEAFIDLLMDDRDNLFAEFSASDLEKAQIVAQFGSALNGIRGDNNTIDFHKLADIGRNPHVAMVEFKLKQAAKRGSKVDASKMEPIAAASRDVARSKPFKSPSVCPEWETPLDVAELVIAARMATGKPVSLKFGVGNVKDMADFLEVLARHDALPEHIQIDGAGKNLGPGSGNAPPPGADGDTSLSARDGVIVVDALLRRLGVRDEVHLVMAGEVNLPTDAAEAMALGADGVVAARTWLAMGVGCAQVKACDTGNCPYGIASKSGSVFAASLDPKDVGPKAAAAAATWHKHLASTLAETGASDWRAFRTTHGLHSTTPRVLDRRDGVDVPLAQLYNASHIATLLAPVMDANEARALIFDRDDAAYLAQQLIDAAKALENITRHHFTSDASSQPAVAAWLDERQAALCDFMQQPRSPAEVEAFLHAGWPKALKKAGLRELAIDAPRSPQRVWMMRNAA